ncbi:MAG TPA: hypothetical protein PLP07_12905 [Pyrinomonadaceae bacterium]|nr:hypothetical protein [Chloracidobacterium sp.]MBL0242415.1 hypothetical protein [Chloracidobacterium sp.]MBP9936465.1 hypothetical protein [Pyrinomonadaceae bacterium]HQX56820.1 hypothetical protein [Pyrinomonadaceae bacterium]HQY68554.1 hypothetical protein [Pyrinomonadaceae bacterium]
MWSKLYLGLIAVSVATVGFFTYYSWSWLQSIGLPIAAIEGYSFNSDIAWYLLWVSFVLLILVGNAILWTTKSSWAVWSSFFYFAAFILMRYFWLEEEAFRFKKMAGLGNGAFSVGPLLGAIIVVVAAIAILGNHFLIIRLNQKLYPDPNAAETVTDNEISEVSN